MTSIRKVALACITAAMVTMPVVAGAQGPANQDTFFTFSQAVELPKTTLPAGVSTSRSKSTGVSQRSDRMVCWGGMSGEQLAKLPWA